MKLGDMVDVKEERGSYTPPITVDYGIGIIVDIANDVYIDFKNVGNINTGKSVKVLLSSGIVKSFHEKDCCIL